MCQEGSTSLMRFLNLKKQLKYTFEIALINIQIEIDNTPKIYRSLGWRYKIGPLIEKINKRILSDLVGSSNFDFIWIDKGVFIKPNILKMLKKKTDKLIHYTPDPAFYYHRSRLFNGGLEYYTHVITTKSFELDLYSKKSNAKVIYSTQGYDEELHYPRVDFNNKEFDLCFVGHYENNRAQIIKSLLDLGFNISLAGPRWILFAWKYRKKNNLIYLGSYLLGDSYSYAISNSKASIGFLSKWIPEKHTTRTFEIPACGTVLITERTPEIEEIFTDNEVVYYSGSENILKVIKEMFEDDKILRTKSELGRNKVLNGMFSHSKIIYNLINELEIG